MKDVLDVAIIGAGHSGLTVSYLLKQRGFGHLVFERGQIGEAWRSHRWDSFALNTPNKYNVLPGAEYTGADPDGFCSAHEFAEQLVSYAASNDLPVRQHASVVSVERSDNDPHFTLSVTEDGAPRTYHAKHVVATSGAQFGRQVPSFADKISPAILQLHTSEYRSPSQLPSGAVLVVGGAQSGCQISEDLADAGRNVYFATSMVPRVPRRYRGRDIVEWFVGIGFYNMPVTAVTDPQMLQVRFPAISGVGERGHTLSLQSLAGKGVMILGKMYEADASHAYLEPNAAAHVQYGDKFSMMAKSMVDDYIAKNGIDAPPPEHDAADIPDADATCASDITSLDFAEHNITSIVWTTGFAPNFSYLKLPVFDTVGLPRHTNGVAEVKGIYFMGLPWMRARKSLMILGAQDDAEYIVNVIEQSK